MSESLSKTSGHDRADVLIVGAGPTGLVLALWLARCGVRVRIVDRSAGPGTTSRAVAVQARTLEFYAQLGIADAVVAGGRKTLAGSMWVAGRRVAHLMLGEIGAGLSPFPYALVFPQDEHEQLLIERLSEAGVTVKRETDLVSFRETPRGVVARLRRADGVEQECIAAYLAGCDGARSTVREVLGIGFPGGTYAHRFYVADVEARGAAANGELHVALDRTDFLAVFPLQGAGRARLIGTVHETHGAAGHQLSWEDVSQRVLAWIPITVERVHWFSTYLVHHRVAQRFREGRVFLLGDAAHIHSPVGGQGMNTGIGDAVNLAWKLAAVLDGRASASLLASYEAERIGFAQRLVATTDRAFTQVTSPRLLARLLRLYVAPRLIPLLLRSQSARRVLFRMVSQIAVAYRKSGISAGWAESLRGGDRLPWIANADGAGEGNFAPLRSLDWQVHVYGAVTPELRTVCERRGLALYVFPWRPEMKRVGLWHNAAYVVRPDGYIGLADTVGSAMAVASYMDSRGLAPQNQL